MIFCFCEHRCTLVCTHTYQLSLFISSKIILHKHESCKTSHFLAGLLKLSWWQSRVNHNRPWVNVSDWKDLPTLLSCQWGIMFPADFPIWPYHCWKPVSEEVSGKMWKRGLPEYGRWRLGSAMVEWLSPGTRSGSLLAIFWTLPLVYYKDTNPEFSQQQQKIINKINREELQFLFWNILSMNISRIGLIHKDPNWLEIKI